jgi:hypothetical protein
MEKEEENEIQKEKEKEIEKIKQRELLGKGKSGILDGNENFKKNATNN